MNSFTGAVLSFTGAVLLFASAMLLLASEVLAQPAAVDAGGAEPSGPKVPTRLIQTPDGVSVLTNKPGDWPSERVDAGAPRSKRTAAPSEASAQPSARGLATGAGTPSPPAAASTAPAPVAASEGSIDSGTVKWGALKWLGPALALVAALIVAAFFAKARR